MAEAAVERLHGPDCPCDRCRGFQVGNQAARRHGAYGSVVVGRRALEIAHALRPTLPLYSAADEPTLTLYAVTLARIELASAALDEIDQTSAGGPLGPYLVEQAEKFARLRDDLRGWVNTARRLGNDLGLSPTSRARLGLDLAATQRILGAELLERYGGAA